MMVNFLICTVQLYMICSHFKLKFASSLFHLVVVDMDDIDSVTMAGTWKQDIVNNAVFTANNGNIKENIADSKLIPILLLGNKMDKVDY